MGTYIILNERPLIVRDGVTVGDLRRRHKPDADIAIVNGFPATDALPMREGDRLTLIRRGEQPDRGEMEALIVARHSPGVHERVKSVCVGIAGLGGLGSLAATALTRVGVGRLVLADHDVVEPSNLNRQEYFLDQLGLLKTDATAANLRRINPYVRVETHAVRIVPENVLTVFERVDALIEAFDGAEEKAMLLDAFCAGRPGVPFVGASGMAGYGPAGAIRVRRLTPSVYIVGDPDSEAAPGRGLMAPRVGIAAHIQANLVLRLMLGESGD